MKRKTLITAFAAGAVTAAAATFIGIGEAFVHVALNTDRIKTKGNKTLKKNSGEVDLPDYTPGIRCQDPGKWSDDPQNYQDAYIVQDKLTLHSRLYTNDSHVYVVFHHGYSSSLTYMGPFVHKVHEHGYNVLAIEPRGHGESQGHYTSMGWYEKDDLVHWIRYINDRDPQAKIILYGISMGASTVMLALGEQLPDNVVCAVEDCGYSSLMEEYVYQCRTTTHYPLFVLLAGDAVTRVKLGFSYFDVNCKKALERNTRPLLLIHGTEDTFVPYEMAQKNYNSTTGEKKLLLIEGATHTRSSSRDPQLYWDTFFAFTDRHLQA